MSRSQASEVIQHVRRILLREGPAVTDGQLLERFIQGREEAALEALVLRHGPMVWGVCWRILRNHHDAEDAFQATFLVLVRRASCVAPREMLGSWLHGVAYQTARKGRATAAKRRAREQQVAVLPERGTTQEPALADWEDWLDRELTSLPEKYRRVLVLCELQGKTIKQAAQELGVPDGTVSGQLARAKVMLAKRLARRGVVLSAAGLATALSAQTAAAGMPLALEAATIKAALQFACGAGCQTAMTQSAASALSANAVALTEGVLKIMLFTKLKPLALGLLALLLVLGGIVAVSSGRTDKNEQDFRKSQVVEDPPGVWEVDLTVTGVLFFGNREVKYKITAKGKDVKGTLTRTSEQGEVSKTQVAIPAAAIAKLWKTIKKVNAMELADSDVPALDGADCTIRLTWSGKSRTIQANGVWPESHRELIVAIGECFDEGAAK